MSDKKTILILSDYYTPGFKAGGPIRSIEGFVREFGDDYIIKIITRDRDINDKVPYKNIKLNSWLDKGQVKIYYLKKTFFEYFNLFRVIQKINYDLIYINSFFSIKMSIFPVVLRALGLIPAKSLLIAPRGEFSPEALKIRPIRKIIYIKLFEFLKSTNDVYWQGSTNYEKKDILKNITKSNEERVLVAGNLSNVTSLIVESEIPQNSNNWHDKLRLVFLSRISVKKNLDYALNVLSNIDFNVEFDIYGPIEDQPYWNKCRKMIENMPDNIKVKYCHTLSHEKVISTLVQYDLFFFPTRGENYGHVIEEAIHAGLPILISDQTPWKNLEQIGVGCEIPLENIEGFIKYLNDFYKLSNEKRVQIKQNVANYSTKIKDKNDIISSNKVMIETALSGANKIASSLKEITKQYPSNSG